jgi:hypothetical protein
MISDRAIAQRRLRRSGKAPVEFSACVAYVSGRSRVVFIVAVRERRTEHSLTSTWRLIRLDDLGELSCFEDKYCLILHGAETIRYD